MRGVLRREIERKRAAGRTENAKCSVGECQRMPKCRRSQPLLHETHLVHIQACRNDEWKAAYAFQNGTYVAQRRSFNSLAYALEPSVRDFLEFLVSNNSSHSLRDLRLSERRSSNASVAKHCFRCVTNTGKTLRWHRCNPWSVHHECSFAPYQHSYPIRGEPTWSLIAEIRDQRALLDRGLFGKNILRRVRILDHQFHSWALARLA